MQISRETQSFMITRGQKYNVRTMLLARAEVKCQLLSLMQLIRPKKLETSYLTVNNTLT